MEETVLQELIDNDDIIYINWLSNYESLFTLTTQVLTKYGSVEKIKEANNISNNNIAAGQKIQIPKL